MKKVLILGAGMVGRAMAIDLSGSCKVTSSDIDSSALDRLAGRPNISTLILDVTDHVALADAIKDYDIVLSAVPGFLGLQTMTEVIKCKKNLVDISFLPEDVRDLDLSARENGVTVVMDCGVAPGLPNYITGYHNEIMKINRMEYMVGGLPKTRKFPFEYKAPFSPCDVIEEYTRPARYVENGRMVVRPAMSDAVLVDFDTPGTLEAFNTDGLRSLIYTMSNIPEMKEKTLRYPGHIRLIQALESAGFLDREPLQVGDSQIVPFDFTSQLLFKSWKSDDEEEEFTVMRILIVGYEADRRKEIIYELYDEFDPIMKLSSMARTTGFTATATVQMILEGLFTEAGVFPPELVGKIPGCFRYVIGYLNDRGVKIKMSEKTL